jgi:hypothetical protein
MWQGLDMYGLIYSTKTHQYMLFLSVRYDFWRCLHDREHGMFVGVAWELG